MGIDAENWVMRMLKREVHFAGLLSNVDSSILKLDLTHDFRIRALSEKEGLDLFSALEGLDSRYGWSQSRFDLLGRLPGTLSCFNAEEKTFYVVCRTFPVTSDPNAQDSSRLLNQLISFHQPVQNYLYPTIRLLRLFKKGDIRIPVSYYYAIEKQKPIRLSKFASMHHVSYEPYRLTSTEYPELETFLKEIGLPIEKAFRRNLLLAFENFELSYYAANLNLSFLALMISLETLLNPGEQEVKHRISRNLAVLLGKDPKQSQDIFREMKELYGKRSKIVHSGQKNIISNQEVERLRFYVRESIKEIHKLGRNLKEVHHLLDERGFGQRIGVAD